MNRGIGSHVSKDDLTPGKEGRTCENLLTVGFQEVEPEAGVGGTAS